MDESLKKAASGDSPGQGKAKGATSAGARMFVLLVLGVLISSYLLFHHVSARGGFQKEPAICDIGGIFDCGKVAQSPYSVFLGIPVASYGLFYYLSAIFIFLLFRPLGHAKEVAAEKTRFADALFFLALLALLPTLAMSFISLFLIGYVCIFCSLQYVLNLMLVVVTWRDRQRSSGFLASVFSGGRQVIGYLIPQVSGHREKVSGSTERVFGLWALVICTAVATYMMPQFLVTQYFLPREQRNQSKDVLWSYVQAWQNSPEVQLPLNLDGSQQEKDFSLGKNEAKITLVEFSDFQCPFCQRASHYLKSIVRKPDSSVQLVFKNYPLDSSCNKSMEHSHHLYACQAAMMARCAGEQNDQLFWQMHDALFKLGGLQWELENLMELPAELVELDQALFDRCLGDKSVFNRVAADAELANGLGIQGTPTIYVNNKLLRFDRLEHLEGILRLILEQTPK